MSESVDHLLGRRLRWRRRALGLTQHDLAQACGVRFQQIAKYESGIHRLSAATLWRLAQALEADVAFFFESPNGPPAANGPGLDPT